MVCLCRGLLFSLVGLTFTAPGQSHDPLTVTLHRQTMYQEQVQRIKDKASMLSLKLEPVLSKPEILKLEKQLGITFPESYKVYLTEIQNGGYSDTLHKNGPYYGIYSIEKSLSDNSEWEVDLNKEFTLINDLHFGDLYDEEEDYEKHCYRYEHDEEYIKSIQNVLDKYQNTDLLSGTLPICEYGSGDFFRVVVNGSNAGQIWAECGIYNASGYYSLNVDILTFYENWLDRQINILNKTSPKLVMAYYPELEFGNNKRYKIIDD